MYVYLCICMYMYLCMHVCIYQNQKIKSKILYSHKTVTLVNINTVICKNKATQKGESR